LIGGVQNIGRVPELQRRILFTFGMLAVYRLGAHIVTPGINPAVIRDFFDQMGGTMFGLFNLFSGGALEQLSVFSLGIMPYISASIIFQLLTVVVPQLEQLQKEGEQGRRKITQWTRYATVVIALFQSLLLAFALESGQFGEGAVVDPGWPFRIMMMMTLTTGTSFIMWLGEQITERGIGNGISLVIFSSIIVRIPSALASLFEAVRTEQFTLLGAILLVTLVIGITGVVVFFERAQRRIPMQHARRVVGRRVMQGGMSYFPLRVNTAGVIPPIFASSILMFPLTLTQFVDSPTVTNFFQDYLSFGSALYNLIYVGLIIFFAYFYTAIIINPADVADNIKRSGAYIPGIRPGKRTAEYIDRILGRLTLIGALYVSAVCVLPVLLSNRGSVPFYFGGTALLIVVGVSLDTIGQIEAHLVSRQYEGFVKGTRIRGRLGR
jgi:preprotein translocase subunit SecY